MNFKILKFLYFQLITLNIFLLNLLSNTSSLLEDVYNIYSMNISKSYHKILILSLKGFPIMFIYLE